MSHDIRQKLDELSHLRQTLHLTKLDEATARADILGPLQEQLDALAAEFQPLYDAVAEREAALIAEIQALTEQAAASVAGLGGLQAVYSEGRETVDIAGLKQYAKTHPEVLQYIRRGKSSVYIKDVGQKRLDAMQRKARPQPPRPPQPDDEDMPF